MTKMYLTTFVIVANICLIILVMAVANLENEHECPMSLIVDSQLQFLKLLAECLLKNLVYRKCMILHLSAC